MKICVYTVLLGGYDALLPQPVSSTSDADFICFTDDATLQDETWTMRLVEPRFPQDLHRSSRVFKILGHDSLRGYDATLYIDASVLLRQDPCLFVTDWLQEGVDMALVKHSYRQVVLDEFDEVIRLNYDDRGRVYEQLLDYANAYPDVLEAQPHWGGMLARRVNPAVDSAMRLWFDHVLRYSRRDQLSLMLALLRGGLSFRSIELDNFDSDLHKWPVIEQRRIAQGKAATFSSGPLLAELRRAERTAAEVASERDELAGRYRDVESALARARAERDGSDARAADADRMIREARAEVRSLQGVRASSRHFAKSIRDAIKRRMRISV